MSRKELVRARASLQATQKSVDALLRVNRVDGFNPTFYNDWNDWKNPYMVSTEHEEQTFAAFSHELVSLISKATEFWITDDSPYVTLRQWCNGECNGYQERVFFAMHALSEDIATVEYLLARCEA